MSTNTKLTSEQIATAPETDMQVWHWTRMARLLPDKCTAQIAYCREMANSLPPRSRTQTMFGKTRPQWVARANAIEALLEQS